MHHCAPRHEKGLSLKEERMITSLACIPKGAARSTPLRFELSKEEYTHLKAVAAGTSKDESNEEAEGDDDDGDNEAAFEDIDSEDEVREEVAADGLLGGNDMVEEDEAFDLMEYGDNALAMNVDDDEDDADVDDDRIKASDKLLAVAISDEDYSHLEVQLYSPEEGSLFVHHDIILPDMPLCLAWLDCPPFKDDSGGQSDCGNYLAVGTMSPAIEIWNLDVMDPLEPSATLGGVATKKKKAKKGKKGSKGKSEMVLRPGSHVDAVMALSWNSSYRQALASGSADCTVKVWDVTSQGCLQTFQHHSDKVQCVSWHPNEAWLLATGSFDNSVGLIDCRTDGSSVATVPIGADIEDMTWDPFNNNLLFCSMEDGVVTCIDIRQTGSALYSFKAHDECASSISFSPLVPSMLATASQDQTVKVWDTACAPEPKCVAYKSMAVGALFTVQYFPGDPFLMAAGGDKGTLALWESETLQEIEAHFKGRVQMSGPMCDGGADMAPHNDSNAGDMELDNEEEVPDDDKKKSKNKKKGKKR